MYNSNGTKQQNIQVTILDTFIDSEKKKKEFNAN